MLIDSPVRVLPFRFVTDSNYSYLETSLIVGRLWFGNGSGSTGGSTSGGGTSSTAPSFFFLSYVLPENVNDHGSSSSFFSGSGADAGSGSGTGSPIKAPFFPFFLILVVPATKPPQPSSCVGFSSAAGAASVEPLNALKSNPFESIFFLSEEHQRLRLSPPAPASFELSSRTSQPGVLLDDPQPEDQPPRLPSPNP